MVPFSDERSAMISTPIVRPSICNTHWDSIRPLGGPIRLKAITTRPFRFDQSRDLVVVAEQSCGSAIAGNSLKFVPRMGFRGRSEAGRRQLAWAIRLHSVAGVTNGFVLPRFRIFLKGSIRSWSPQFPSWFLDGTEQIGWISYRDRARRNAF